MENSIKVEIAKELGKVMKTLINLNILTINFQYKKRFFTNLNNYK
jgi:hypothetical protein